jgi:hypothetical protein
MAFPCLALTCSCHSFETRPGRPGSVAGPGLSKKQVGNWFGETRSTWINPAETQPYYIYIYIYIYIYTHTTETTSFWPFTVERPKREEFSIERNERSAEDLINFKPNSRNLQTHFSHEEEQRSRRLLIP